MIAELKMVEIHFISQLVKFKVTRVIIDHLLMQSMRQRAVSRLKSQVYVTTPGLMVVELTARGNQGNTGMGVI